MSGKIEIEYNKIIDAITVRMPDKVTFDALKKWRSDFLALLKKHENYQCPALLIDVNKHDFESIDSLKLLRDLLDDLVVKNIISRIAFVIPKQFKELGIRSKREAYFETCDEAYIWIKSF